MKPTLEKNVRRSGGTKRSVGTVRLKIPLRKLNIITDVDLFLLSENVPSLLSMKDMVENGLDISIQDCTERYGDRTQALSVENYFYRTRVVP